MPENKNRRTDLEVIPVPFDRSLIASEVMPPMYMGKSSGVVFYQGVLEAAAQTDREAGEAPTRTNIGSASVTYNCGEVIARYYIPENNVEDKGGIENCDNVGTKAAMLSVLRNGETAVANLLFNNGAATAVGTDIVTQVKAFTEDLLAYDGETAVVLSQTAYNVIIARAEVAAALNRFSAVTPADNEQILSLNSRLLAMVFGVDRVLIGADKYWGTTTANKQKAVVMKIAPKEEESENLGAVFGKQIIYQPWEHEFEIRAWYNDNDLTWNYDALKRATYQVFNAGAAKVISGIGA